MKKLESAIKMGVLVNTRYNYLPLIVYAETSLRYVATSFSSLPSSQPFSLRPW